MLKVKLFKPFVSREAINNCIRVLKSGQLAEGEEVKKFEKDFGNKFHFENVVAVNSGTSALELAYELANIEENDEVITSVLTCTATNIPLIRRKAKIIFTDIEDDLNISIKDVERKITDRTKAIVFVHFGGNNRGLKDILKLGKKYKITIIEDAAQAVGSEYWGKSDFVCVSLQAIKILTSGDGGFLICKKKKDYEKARRLRWFGYNRDLKQKLGDIDLKEAGYKYHMNNISAAIGRGNLLHIDKLIKQRKKIIEIYRKARFNSNIWLTSVLSDNKKKIIKKLKEKGIETGIYHYRNDKYTILKQYKTDCQNMDKLEDKYFLIPMGHNISQKQAKIICKIIKYESIKLLANIKSD